MKDEVRREHPSFGAITVNRSTGNYRNLFQSNIEDRSAMVLTIIRALERVTNSAREDVGIVSFTVKAR